MNKTIRIAVLPSFTLNGIEEALSARCKAAGISAEIHLGAYGQYAQEILTPGSALYRFKPDLVALFVDAQTLLGDKWFNPYAASEAERRNWVKTAKRGLLDLVGKLKERSPATVLLHNLQVPARSPLGILENKQGFGLFEAVEELNAALREGSKSDPRFFVFDYEAFCARMGKAHVRDPKMYYLGDVRLDFQRLGDLAEAYMAYIKPLAGRARKCLVLDLDNTLWGGILGEDGLEGIQLGPTPEGRPFWELQKYLLGLHQRGVLLAVNSRNNAAEALKALRKHPHMVLKEKHFAALRINWEDKVSNMRSIAKELNLDLDSFVLVDDDKANREIVRRALPKVLVVDLPEDQALYLEALSALDDFNTLHLTKEDRQRGRMYAAQRRRLEFQQSAGSLDKYLAGLGMRATIRPAQGSDVPRLAQLCQRTNQFNMTSRRYREEDIRALASDKDSLVFSVRVEDKFGDNGLVGMAVVQKTPAHWRIDSFLLSCRVIGRGIERAMLAYIVKSARKAKAEGLVGEFVPSSKNDPAKGFYQNSGFRRGGKRGAVERWRYDLKKDFPYPKFIQHEEA